MVPMDPWHGIYTTCIGLNTMTTTRKTQRPVVGVPFMSAIMVANILIWINGGSLVSTSDMSTALLINLQILWMVLVPVRNVQTVPISETHLKPNIYARRYWIPQNQVVGKKWVRSRQSN